MPTVRDLTFIKMTHNLFILVLFFLASKTFNMFRILNTLTITLWERWAGVVASIFTIRSLKHQNNQGCAQGYQARQWWQCENQIPGLGTFRASLLSGYFWLLDDLDINSNNCIHVLFTYSFSLCLLINLPWGWYKVFIYRASELFPTKQ